MIRLAVIALVLASAPFAAVGQSVNMDAVCSLIRPGTSIIIDLNKISRAQDGIGCYLINLRAVNELCRAGKGQDLDCAEAAREEVEHGR